MKTQHSHKKIKLLKKNFFWIPRFIVLGVRVCAQLVLPWYMNEWVDDLHRIPSLFMMTGHRCPCYAYVSHMLVLKELI